jgi:hypothetical protein
VSPIYILMIGRFQREYVITHPGYLLKLLQDSPPADRHASG